MKGTCFFIGHRDAGYELEKELSRAVEALIQAGEVSSFFVGRYGNFDQMAAKAVIEAKYVRRPGKARDFLEYAQNAERTGRLRIRRI